MNVVYAPLINVQGTLDQVDADFDGNVTLVVKVKGRDAQITLPVREALRLFRDLKALDIEALARIHAA